MSTFFFFLLILKALMPYFTSSETTQLYLVSALYVHTIVKPTDTSFGLYLTVLLIEWLLNENF